MARSPVIQMQNWLFNNQQWFCGPLGSVQHNGDAFWAQYAEALQDATGKLAAVLATGLGFTPRHQP